MHTITVLPQGIRLTAPDGASLLSVLQKAGLVPEAFCGGSGKCGKCSVIANGAPLLSCRTTVHGDMCVAVELVQKTAAEMPAEEGEVLAFDIGTTSVACSLLTAGGARLKTASALNPQSSYGADVVSRLRSAAKGTRTAQTELIRACMTELISSVCARPERIKAVCVVGNPAMQQLFLGMDTRNLTEIPFAPVITRVQTVSAKEYLPVCANAALHIVPDVSGYVGADTVACVLAEKTLENEKLTLLVDIGTNGELVLGNRDGAVCCATAAGPALEGADITCGMRGTVGAIDRVYAENGAIKCHVIGETAAKGICGSGLIDAAAVLLDAGLIDARGRIRSGEDKIALADGVYLTQEDVRRLQLAKGAIAAGIRLLAEALGAALCDIDRVLLAGAFGTAIEPKSACRIGLIPCELEEKLTAVGNAALRGAERCALLPEALAESEKISRVLRPVELATLPRFSKEFAKNMYF